MFPNNFQIPELTPHKQLDSFKLKILPNVCFCTFRPDLKVTPYGLRHIVLVLVYKPIKILLSSPRKTNTYQVYYVVLSANSNHCYFLAGFPRLLFDLLCQRATSCLPVLSLPWPGLAVPANHAGRPAAVDLPELSVCAKPQKMQSIWAAQWANRSLQTVALPFSRLLARAGAG